MIVVSSVAANVAAIVGGVLVFGDPIGSDALGVAARSRRLRRRDRRRGADPGARGTAPAPQPA